MIRTIPAKLLTLCLVPAAAALAQSATSADPASPPAHQEGMEHGRFGPGGPGFRGPMMGRGVAPIANAPFSATFTETANLDDRQGRQVQRSSTRNVYRDSAGRTREDITLPPPPPRPSDAGEQASAPSTPSTPRVMTVIVDPVANTITRLNAERRTAFVETVPADFFKREQKWSGAAPDGAPRRDGGAVTDLGSKTIAGVIANGKRTTHTMPGQEGDSTRAMTRESWFAPDLKVEVSETDTTPRGTRSEIATSITKAEPPANLFQVPEGYAIKQVPGHPFHGRDRGEHGPDDRGADGPPPPPAM